MKRILQLILVITLTATSVKGQQTEQQDIADPVEMAMQQLEEKRKQEVQKQQEQTQQDTKDIEQPATVVQPIIISGTPAYDIRFKLLEFQSELIKLAKTDQTINPNSETDLKIMVKMGNNRIQTMKQAISSFDIKWNTYCQAQQATISEEEDLMTKMADIQQLRQVLVDSLETQANKYNMLADINKAENIIFSNKATYEKMEKEAIEMSIIKKTAPQLEKVKGKEQILFTQIQTSFDKAKAALETFPQLKQRIKILEDKYVEIAGISAKIQATEYKPFIQRIKDYLLGLAATAILLLFINMVAAKIKAAKAARDTAKKYKDMLNKDENGIEYPTI